MATIEISSVYNFTRAEPSLFGDAFTNAAGSAGVPSEAFPLSYVSGAYLGGENWLVAPFSDENEFVATFSGADGNTYKLGCSYTGWGAVALDDVTPTTKAFGNAGTMPVYTVSYCANYMASGVPEGFFLGPIKIRQGFAGNVFDLDSTKDLVGTPTIKYSTDGTTWTDAPPWWFRRINPGTAGLVIFNPVLNLSGADRKVYVHFKNASFGGKSKSGSQFGLEITQSGSDDSLNYSNMFEVFGSKISGVVPSPVYSGSMCLSVPYGAARIDFKLFLPNLAVNSNNAVSLLKSYYTRANYEREGDYEHSYVTATSTTVVAEGGNVYSVSIDFGASVGEPRIFYCTGTDTISEELFGEEVGNSNFTRECPYYFKEVFSARSMGVRDCANRTSVSPIPKSASSASGEYVFLYTKKFNGKYTVTVSSGAGWLALGDATDVNYGYETLSVTESDLLAEEDYVRTLVALKFSANTGPARTATLTITNADFPEASTTYTIEQEGEPFEIDPEQAQVLAEGGTATATVSAGDLSALTISASDGLGGGSPKVSVSSSLDSATGALSVQIGAIPLTSRNYEMTVITVSDTAGNSVTLSIEQTVAIYVMRAEGGEVLNVAGGGASRAPVELAAGGASLTLTAQAAEDGDFSVESDAAWLSAAFAGGTATAAGMLVGDTCALTLTAEANTGNAPRTATLTLRSSASSVPVYVDVTQPRALSVSPTETTFTAYGGSATVAFTAATEADAPTAAATSAEWLSAQPDGTITASAWTSTDEISRSATATFTAPSGASAAVTVTQKGVFKVAASPALLRLPLRGGSASVALTLSARAAAVGVGELKRSAEWFSVSVVGATATVSAEANATGASRSGTFYWLNSAEGHSDVVSVVQPGGVTATPSSVEFQAPGGVAAVSVESAAGAYAESAETDAEWLSASPDGTLTAEANAGKSPRTATATFHADGASASVAVRQLAPRRVPAMFFRGARVVG